MAHVTTTRSAPSITSVPPQPRPPSSVYSATSRRRRSSSSITGPTKSTILRFCTKPLSQNHGFPCTSPRTTPSPSPPSSTVSSDFSSSSRNTERGRARPRPPPLNMAAVAEGQNRGSLTSLPDLLDRATRLHDVLSAGRTASVLNSGFPGGDSRTPTEISTSQRMILYEMSNYSWVRRYVGSFSCSAPQRRYLEIRTPSELRTSWPLFNLPIGRSQVPQRIHSPLRQIKLGRGIVSERTMNTPSPPR